MPLKFEIKLSLKLKNEVEQPPLITPDLLHGFFFNLIPKKLAEELHRPSRYKPFCLWSKDIFNPQGPYEELTVTISLLKDVFFPQILAELLEDKKNLFLGPYGVRLQKFEGRLIKNDQYLSYEELRQIKPKPNLYFYFQTPVSFKKGDIALLFTDGLLEFLYTQSKYKKETSANEYDMLQELIKGHNSIQSLEKLFTSLFETDNNNTTAAISDDITIITLQKE
jgi:hypothetical protein